MVEIARTMLKVQEMDVKSKLSEDTLGWLQAPNKVEEILYCKFKNKKLLELAFTHNSFHDKSSSYEHLEYINNLVLNLFVIKDQYSLYLDLSSKGLT